MKKFGEKAAVRNRLGYAVVSGALAVLAATTLSGCGSSPSTSDTASSGTAQQSSASEVNAANSTSAEPTTQQPDTSTNTGGGSNSGGSDASVVGPNGYGKLTLGMTKEQALATGTVAADNPSPAAPPCVQYSYKTSSNVKVWIQPKGGLVGISFAHDMHTPEHIALGSPLAQVRAAYPDFKAGEPSGLSVVKVPGNPKAHYQISVSDKTNKVIDMKLLGPQECFD